MICNSQTQEGGEGSHLLSAQVDWLCPCSSVSMSSTNPSLQVVKRNQPSGTRVPGTPWHAGFLEPAGQSSSYGVCLPFAGWGGQTQSWKLHPDNIVIFIVRLHSVLVIINIQLQYSPFYCLNLNYWYCNKIWDFNFIHPFQQLINNVYAYSLCKRRSEHDL